MSLSFGSLQEEERVWASARSRKKKEFELRLTPGRGKRRRGEERRRHWAKLCPLLLFGIERKLCPFFDFWLLTLTFDSLTLYFYYDYFHDFYFWLDFDSVLLHRYLYYLYFFSICLPLLSPFVVFFYVLRDLYLIYCQRKYDKILIFILNLTFDKK